MLLVIDASVAVKCLVSEEDSVASEQLLGRGHVLHAPRLLVSEVLNAIRNNAICNKERSGDITSQQAFEIANQATRLSGLRANDEQLGAGALQLALDLQHPIYDCMYLALARDIGGLVVTADRRFYDVVESSDHAGTVFRLGTFEPR